jgi:putative aminopeptidase FrvX
MNRKSHDTVLARRAELIEMLRARRPSGSKTEEKWIARWIDPLEPEIDGFGNRILRIGDAPVLWSSHTDTVHRTPGNQRVNVRKGIASVGGKSNCLGADDTAGVWLMVQMARQGVPGLYVWHRAEEIGGLGSDWIALNTPELLDGIRFAIALDRKGASSVITHQFARCCSDDFADSLCRELGMGYMRDDTGLFTDTANYVDLVGECTNISVGYEHEHSPYETLDLEHADRLLAVLIGLDWRNLVEARHPGEYEEYSDVTYTYTGDSLSDLVRAHPDIATDILESCGISEHDFRELLREYGLTY